MSLPNTGPSALIEANDLLHLGFHTADDGTPRPGRARCTTVNENPILIDLLATTWFPINTSDRF